MTSDISGLDASTFDPAIRPQDDLFRHVNGPWLRDYEIPGDRSSDGHFRRLVDEAEEQVRDIIQEAPIGSQIGDLYASFMNEERIEAIGVAPLASVLAIVDEAATHDELAVTLGRLQRHGVSGAVGYYVYADAKDPSRHVVYFGQGGIGLPDESYYREDEHAEIRAAYVAHVDRMASLSGLEYTGAGILTLETGIASAHWDVVKSREADLSYNPTTLTDLVTDAPGFPWAEWAKAIHLPEAAHGLLVVSQPDFLVAFAAQWSTTPLDAWKAWIRHRILGGAAALLNKEIAQADFDFYGTTLSGTPEMRERWKRGVGMVEGTIGESVAQVYVDRHFPASHKQAMDTLVANLVEAYRDSITNLEWMTPATRERALVKLDKFVTKVGYPIKWRDYSEIDIIADDLLGNSRRAHRVEEDRDWAKIGQPVDRDEWLMTPQTVNAYYNPVMNEIVFPAAILQPPFFNADADDAVNYGGIGAVIGHEIGHGFDDQGSKFDGDGKLEDWWVEADRTAFMERAGALITQYDGYSPAQLSDDHTVNGAFTIGENIGDLGGLAIALKAYEIALGGPLDTAPVIDGLTGAQRVFYGWAQAWQTKARDEYALRLLATDPHSPAEFRCNGIVRNIDAFYEAFGVVEGDALWLAPEDRVSIW